MTNKFQETNFQNSILAEMKSAIVICKIEIYLKFVFCHLEFAACPAQALQIKIL